MSVDDGIYIFGRFQLDTARRSLLADETPIAVSSRAFDVLQYLVENADRVVSKDEILERVWAGTFVEENNLAVQISALRKILADRTHGESFIVTIPGKGYRFVGRLEIRAISTPEAVEPARAPTPPRSLKGEASAPRIEASAPRISEGGWRKSGRRTRGAAIAILAILVAAAVAALLAVFSPEPEGAPRLSIVVMPFRNLSAEPGQDYLADAVSDDLTTDLSHIPGSFVIARQSSDVYKGRQVGAAQIGRELGVRYLLEGSVRPSDKTIQINAQLIDTKTGAHLWADRFDTPRGQFSEAQEEIVRRIGSALDIKLVAIEGQKSLEDRSGNPDALDLFLRARSITDRDNTLEGLNQAQALLEKSIALKPDFAEAIIALAQLLLTKARDYDDPTTSRDMDRARQLVGLALELAPQDAPALAARGFLLMIDQDYEGAMASFRLALAREPNSLNARFGLARCLDTLGHPEESVDLIKEVLRRDPLNPQNPLRDQQLGMALLMLGRNDEATEWLQRAAAGNSVPMEYTEMAGIAADRLTGRKSEAAAKYLAYAARWPHRSAWRLACYATKAQSILEGFKAMSAALEAAGMPNHADETEDDGVTPVAEPREAGDFEPTPLTVPGARTVTTAQLASFLRDNPTTVVIDVGCGAATVRGAVWLSWVESDTLLSPEGRKQLREELDRRLNGDRDRPVVVMGSGAYGWGSYNAALAVLAFGYRQVLWHRGGEEAWAASGLPAEDRRDR